MKWFSFFFKTGTMILLFLFSCKRDKPTETLLDFGYNYFPDNVGRYVIYEVDSIAYDDTVHPPDTTRYLLKEIIAATFLDNSGRPTLKIERFRKMYNNAIPYDSMDWKGPRVWFANRTSITAEKVEENIRYIKLVFPVKKGRKWDGNLYNTLGEKVYEMISADVAETINNIHFDSVITVKQSEQITWIGNIYEIEKYSKNIGLIYKEHDSIYDGGTTTRVGYAFKQKIISYGK